MLFCVPLLKARPVVMRRNPSVLWFMLWVVSQAGCDVSKSSGATAVAGPPCVGPNCLSGVQYKDDFKLPSLAASAAVAGAASGGGRGTLPPLCAVQKPSCDPDDASSCLNVAPSVGPGGSLIGDALAGSAGRGQFAAGMSSQGGGNSAGHVDGIDSANAAGAPPMGCRIQRDHYVVLASCEPVGTGTTGAPCVSRADCAAGFACIEESGTAQCRKYCCRGVGSCPSGSYCDSRPTKELVSTTERLGVSVCMPGIECRFDEPYPCPSDRVCSCPTGRTCGLVRSDGTTACVEVTPGSGTEGQPCPCAANHVCSEALGTCLRICRPPSDGSACATGICQATASLPAGWGVCIGASEPK